MSMLKAKCDFDGGDCCPNETFSHIWDTYCNNCQCLEWPRLVENSKEQFCLTLYWFTWLKIEIHQIFEKNHLGLSSFLISCFCWSVFIWFFLSYFSNPGTLTKIWRFFCIKVLYLINIDFLLSMIWGQLHSGQYN